MGNRRVKASELEVTEELREVVGSMLAPIEAWENIAAPDAYLESKTGLYLSGLERLLEKAIELNDLGMVRALLLDLLKMTKLGRPKADVNLGGFNKLRMEEDFSRASTEELKKLLGKGVLE